MSFNPEEIVLPGARIKVIGIGGGGGNAVNTMIRSNIDSVDFITANTDIQALRFALSPNKIQVGKELTKGLGAGADPDVGRDAALEDRHEILEMISGADMVFVTAGMGGGTGTGGAAVIAQIAKESGALTVGVVTKPFAFEGKRRSRHAEIGIARLRENVDTLIIIPNDRLLQVATPDLSMIDAFKLADNVLVNAVRGISDIINVPGTVNVDFADVKAVMSSMGQALMGIGIAEGDNRATEAATQAISSPLLEDVDIEGATGLLINITAGSNVSLMEVNTACSIVQEAAHEDANIIFGAVIDEAMGEAMRVTVIATGFPGDEENRIDIPDTEVRYAKKPISFTGRSLNSMRSPYAKKETTVSNKNSTLFTKHFMQQTENKVHEKSPLSSIASESEELTRMTLSNADLNTNNNTVSNEGNLGPIINPMTSKILETHPASDIGKPAFLDSDFSDTKKTALTNTDSDSYQRASAEFDIDDDNDSVELLSDFNDDFTKDIDEKIDQALEVASRVEEANKDADEDLDVPAFLRQGMKDIPLD